MRSVVAVSLLTALIGAAEPAWADTVTIVCGVVPQSVELCRSGSEAWAKSRGHEVRVLSYPDSSTRARELIGDLLDAQAEDLDVLELDIVWSGMLASHLLDLGSDPELAVDGFFPAALASFKVGGHLLAVPWNIGVGRLLYRTDLLERHGLAAEDVGGVRRRRAHDPRRRARRRQRRFLGLSLAGPGQRGAYRERARMDRQRGGARDLRR